MVKSPKELPFEYANGAPALMIPLSAHRSRPEFRNSGVIGLQKFGYPALNSPEMSSPQQARPRPGLKAFFPLSEDVTISTRGQALPGLIKDFGTPPAHRKSTFRFDLTEDPEVQRRLGGWSRRNSLSTDEPEERPSFERRQSEHAAKILMTPQMRSQRLIGHSNPRYRWQQYYKSEDELKKMKKPIREYYERNNYLIQQYLFIDRLLDSSLPHDLIQEYNQPLGRASSRVSIPSTIGESPVTAPIPIAGSMGDHSNFTVEPESVGSASNGEAKPFHKLKRTPKDLYKIPERNENTPLLRPPSQDGTDEYPDLPDWEPEDDTDSGHRDVTIAIYMNLAANTALLAMKIVVTVLTSSVSVLASLVDAALDMLSTAIIWTTTRLIAQPDQYKYPVGRRRLEPIGVLVFSVIMVTSFVQVALEGLSRLTGDDHKLVELSVTAIVIMASTVVIKLFCWLWCRLINNSSVQALAQDAMTDVVFNIFSIIFPMVGYYARIWWLDSLGGILLSLYVIHNWLQTVSTHIRNLTGAAATADERNVLLYLTMRFAKTIRKIQGLQAYHAGDKLNVEVDIVLDGNMALRDSHDLGESLQYVLESVPIVDRAFVHLDYASYNLPTHMQQ